MNDTQQPLGWATWLVLAFAGVVWAGVAFARPLGWVELGLGGVVLAGLVVAVASLRSQGILRALVRGPAQKPRVALTFDDGPDPATTPKVLDILRNHGARATFFVLAYKAENHPDLVRAMLAEGHEIALHGETHHWQSFVLPWRALATLNQGKARLAALTGKDPRYFRPPYGIAIPAMRGAVAKAKLRVVAWTVRTMDGTGRGEPSMRVDQAMRQMKPGAIVLLHDAPERPGGRLPLGPAMLDGLLRRLAARELESVTLTELLAG